MKNKMKKTMKTLLLLTLLSPLGQANAGIFSDDYVLSVDPCGSTGILTYAFKYKVCRVPTELGATVTGAKISIKNLKSTEYGPGMSDTASGYCQDAQLRVSQAKVDLSKTPCADLQDQSSR